MSSSRQSKVAEVPIALGVVAGNDDCSSSSKLPDNNNNNNHQHSPTFRRWSRNLSAKQHRELNRLNQIERRRQFLELKGQNDLFNQMRISVDRAAAAAAAAAAASASDESAVDCSTSSAKPGNKSRHLISGCPLNEIREKQQVQCASKDESGYACDDAPIKASPAVNSSKLQPLTSAASVSASARELTTDPQLQQPTVTLAARGKPVTKTYSQKTSQITANNDNMGCSVDEKTDKQSKSSRNGTVKAAATTTTITTSRQHANPSQPISPVPVPLSASASASQPAALERASKEQQQVASRQPELSGVWLDREMNKRREREKREQFRDDNEEDEEEEEEGEEENAVVSAGCLSSDLLARFVSEQVPANKRVLCLIVRDKMSRLNKAKSYFYPTYYLFIQAIVDIESESTDHLLTGASSDSNHTNAIGQQQQQREYSSSTEQLELLCSTTGQRASKLFTTGKGATCTPDNNSFSASSSISADMLFIGATTADQITATGGLHESQVQGFEMSANSFSDIEVAHTATTENEDEPNEAEDAEAENLKGFDAGEWRRSSADISWKNSKIRRKKQQVLISLKGIQGGSSDNLQGRDSPLVFPNPDNNNNDNKFSTMNGAEQTGEGGERLDIALSGFSSRATWSSKREHDVDVDIDDDDKDKIKSTASHLFSTSSKQKQAPLISGSSDRSHTTRAAHTATYIGVSAASNSSRFASETAPTTNDDETCYWIRDEDDYEEEDREAHRADSEPESCNRMVYEKEAKVKGRNIKSSVKKKKKKKKKKQLWAADEDGDGRERESEDDDDDEDDADGDSDNEEQKQTSSSWHHNEQTSSLLGKRKELKSRRELEAAGETTGSSHYEHLSFFNNDKNPYTGTNGVLLAGRRRKKAKTYLIGPNEFGYTRKNSICKLKSNVLGTQFNAIRLNNIAASDNFVNDRCNIVSISYETNVLGFKGPRKMRVFLAKEANGGAKNLFELHKKNPNAVVHLKNMTPSWNIESQSYVLNFHGRVTQASVKNFQLIEFKEDNNRRVTPVGSGKQSIREKSTQSQIIGGGETLSPIHNSKHGAYDGKPPQQLSDNLTTSVALNSTRSNNELNHYELGNCLDKSLLLTAGNKANMTYNKSIVMQFGRISNNEFTCDVTYPLSILQAFTIALSSFDSKLACE